MITLPWLLVVVMGQTVVVVYVVLVTVLSFKVVGELVLLAYDVVRGVDVGLWQPPLQLVMVVTEVVEVVIVWPFASVVVSGQTVVVV